MSCRKVIDNWSKCFAIPFVLLLCLSVLGAPKAQAQVFPNTATSSPIVVVNFATTSATPLNPGFSGFNSSLLNAVEYYDPNYQHILATLSPGALGFPGGTDSEAFNWASGQLVQTWVDGLSAKAYTHDINANALPIVAGKGGSSFSDFAALAANLGGAKIIVSVNAYTDSPESAHAFAQYALANHIPVAAWELANEPYTWVTTDAGTPGFFTDATDYATKMKPYRDAIKAADPNAVVTLYFSEAGHPDKLWDNTLANYTPQYWDAVTYHEYVFAGNLIAFDDLMAAANGQLFSNTTSYLTGYLMPKNAPGMPYIISEVGPAAGQGGPLLGTLYGGIYSAEFSLRMSTIPQVKHVSSFQVLSNAGIDETNRHLNVVQAAYSSGTTTNTTGLNFGFFLSAQVAGEAVANGALHNSIGVYTTTTTGGPTAPTSGGGSIPAIYAQAYDGGNSKRYVVLTNKSISTAVARIMQDGADLSNPMQMTFVTGTDPSLPNFGTIPDNVQIRTQTITDPGAVTIPPYSVVRLEWSVSPCSYTMSLGGQVFPASGGSGTITFIAPANCPWTVGPLPSWITVSGPSSGTGSGTVNYNVLPGSGGVSASIIIGGTPFTVEQQPASIPGLSLTGSMPHIAAEENWTTAFTLVNKSNAKATARLSLFGDPSDTSGNGPLSLPLAFPQISPPPAPEVAASLDRSIAANASLIIDSAGQQIPPVQVGSAQLSATAAVDGFAIFHLIPGAQEAVVPLETRNANSYLLAFDNTGGVVLGVAVENVSAQPAVIPVIIRDDTGALIGAAGATISLARNGHTSFVLSTLYPVTASKRGTIEFDRPAGGQISVLGIRTTPLGSSTTLTTIPALANVGTTGGSIAHIATGNGWQTTFVLVNAGTTAAPVHLKFFADVTGLPLSLPISFPQIGSTVTTAPSVDQTLAAGATLIVQSAAPLSNPVPTIGSAQLSTTGNVSGFVIFRYNPNGQEAVVPIESRTANAYLLAFDNTSGTATGIAINSVSSESVNVPVVVRDDTGAQIGTDTLTLAANGHLAFTLVADKYPVTANLRGTVEFDAPAGAQIGVLGIRIPVAHTFTTLPALAK